MATNFPSSQDNFTNPTSSDTLDSPDHAAQHTNVNDAVEAIELALLDGAPMYIDDTNERVGIGTTSPSVKVEVADGTNAELRLNDTGGTVGGSLNAKLALKGNGSSAGVLGFNNTASGILTLTNEDGQVYLQTKSNDSLLLRTDSTTRVTVTGTGDVGIGTTSPSAELDVNGQVESTTLRLTSTVDATNTSTGHAFQIGNAGGGHLQIDDNGVQRRSTGGTTSNLHLQQNGGTLRIGNTTDADVYLNGFLQGHWTSYTPTLYTGNYSGSPTHTLGSAGAITARYCVWGNVVFVQLDVSYGTFTSGNSTKQPRFSVPSGLRVVPTRGVGNGQGDFMGVGNMSGYQTHDYIGAMMAFNDGQHSSNGFLQFTQADSSSAGGNYNAYDAMYSGSTYFNDDLVTAYGRIAMSGWYRTDAL